ncbi:immunoglobulin-like and fibronectin type III domain-containing protein 1 [Emydura macquarii macquarii]|uniref:immunoglobulin-like and fibronectin type III domain-containing protein 1 n=1 Tax=Emydura macquarii macquarii TaxID=1129001 RepID=UPI00352A3AFE
MLTSRVTMESRRAVKTLKKSSIPGVTIKQFVEDIPKGCSLPDFERKPVTLSLQEGKNAMFRAVVKGEPTPEVIWKRSKEEMNNSDKYQMFFNAVTTEFILQINKLTAEDTDLYHCSAVNEYGEAACSAGLKVIQVSFKKNAKPFPIEPQEDLKKELQDFRKTLRKRTPLPAQKKEIDMEQVWQLLLNADRKDYEKICLKYGIVDFRGMLRKLQQMKEDREDKQQQYIYSVTNLKHIKVNKEGNATFHLEIDLKNPESRIYLYKDGQMINYGFDNDKVKHCLRQTGKKYNFTINHLQLEDAGMYQIKVEDVVVFSTELETDSARGKRRQAEGDGTDKTGWQTDKSMLTDEEGAKKLLEGEGLVDQSHVKSTGMGKDGQYGSNQHGSRELYGFSMNVDWRHGSLGQDGRTGRMGKDGRIGKGQFSGAGTNGGSVANGASNEGGRIGKIHGQDFKLGGACIDDAIVEMGLHSFYGKDSILGGAGSGGRLVGVGGLGSLEGRDSMVGGAGTGLGDSRELDSLHGMEGGASAGGAGLGGAGSMGSLHGKDAMLGGAGVGIGLDGAGRMGALGGKDAIVGASDVGAGLGSAGATSSLSGNDGMLEGDGGSGAALGGAGGMGCLSGKGSMLGGAGVGIGLDDIGARGALGGRDAILSASDVGGAGLGGAGGRGSLCGKDAMQGAASAGSTGAGGIRPFYDKDGMLSGAGASVCGAGLDDAYGMESLYGKDGMIGAVGAVAGGDEAVVGGACAGVGGTGATRSLYGKDSMVGGADAGGAGAGSDFGGAVGMESLSGKNGLIGGAGSWAGGFGAGVGGPERMGTLSGKDAILGGPGAGLRGAGGLGSLYSKDGVLSAVQGGVRGERYLYGEDDVLGGADTGLDGTGRTGSVYGKDPILGGPGVGGAGLAGARGMSSLSGKDAMLGRAGAGGGLDSSGGMGAIDGRDAVLGGAGPGSAGVSTGLGGAGSLYGKDAVVGGAGVAGGMSALDGRDSMLSAASAGSAGAGGIWSLYGKDGMVSGTGPSTGAGLSGAGGIESLYGKDVMFGVTNAGAGVGGAGGLDSIHSKGSLLGEAGPGTGGEFIGARGIGSLDGSHSLLDGAVASGGDGGLGFFGSLYGRDRALGGAAVGAGDKLHDGSIDGKMPGVHGEGSLGYDQMSGHHGGVQADVRRGQISAEENLKNRDRKRRGGFLQDEARESHCHFDRGLSDVSAQKGKPAVLPCSLRNGQVAGIWFKDEFKLTGLDEISSEKDGLVHKDTVEDNHAGKYKFEAEGVKTEASIFVEDPPSVDKALLEKLMKEPVVVKAGQNAMVKIPFKGQKPVRATWLKDGDELLDDTRIHIDKADNFTQLSISSTNRKDCGDYKVKLKNESGTLKASLKLVVIDKPQKPIGPLEVVDRSTTGITIRWKPPKDDGGKPVQNYIIERQQMGRKAWVTLGNTNGSDTTFTTDKLEHNKSYCFRVRAVNAQGNSEVLESDEVMAATRAFPSPPAPPKIVSANKDSITLSWAAPPKTGNSRILGYIVEKRKKGSNVWTPITDLPITDRKLLVTDLKEGLQYEFRVAAINAAGAGEASAPSDAVFARDPMKPPGRVRDLKVTNTDYISITLAWTKPDSEEGCSAKGYEVEKRSSDSLKWTQCNTVPIQMTTYTVKGLQAREMYFLRVRAINEGGLGEAVALDTCIQAVPPIVSPRFLRDDTMKNFMIIKAGNCIRVHIPFEASPTPEVIWLKDGLPLHSRAMVTTTDCLSQLLIPSAEFSDSGLYTIILQNDWGKKESFSFQVKVTDIPQSPGLIWLQEKVFNTVTVIWEPSPTEKQESTLYYMVMKRDSSKSSWQVVGDLIYTNKFTITKLIPGRRYYFRVVAKNYMGTSDPSETVQPWIIQKEKGKKAFKKSISASELESLGPTHMATAWQLTKGAMNPDLESQALAILQVGCQMQILSARGGGCFLTQPLAHGAILECVFMSLIDEFKVRLPKYRGVNENMPPRFLVQLKPHVVTTAFDCHMSCAVSGYPKPKITWYKDGRNLSEDPTFFSTNDFGVCCLVIPDVTKRDEGEYKVEATNELGHAVSKALLIIKGKDPRMTLVKSLSLCALDCICQIGDGASQGGYEDKHVTDWEEFRYCGNGTSEVP